jgi:hypothetical protein
MAGKSKGTRRIVSLIPLAKSVRSAEKVLSRILKKRIPAEQRRALEALESQLLQIDKRLTDICRPMGFYIG